MNPIGRRVNALYANTPLERDLPRDETALCSYEQISNQPLFYFPASPFLHLYKQTLF